MYNTHPPTPHFSIKLGLFINNTYYNILYRRYINITECMYNS